MTMGEKILAMRKARGWSQEELAEHIGVTRQAVSRWESDSAKPDADKIIAVCDLFGVSADYLLRDYATGAAAPMSEQTEPPKQTTAIGDAMRTMTLGQWFCLGAAVLGALMLLILRFVYIFQDTNYVHYSLNGNAYSGYQGFIRTEELLGLHYGAWVCVLLPLIVWFCKWVKRQAAEFFCWGA